MYLKSIARVASAVVLLAGCAGGGGESPQQEAQHRLAAMPASVSEGEADVSLKPRSGPALANPVKTDAPESSPVETDASGDPSPDPLPSSGGTVAEYDPNALPLAGGETSDRFAWPAWRRDLARWQWIRIAGSDLSTVRPDPAVPGSLGARINAWNGLAADTRHNRLYSVGNGGHADYSGNEAYEIDLSADEPRWTMLHAPSANEVIVASNQSLGIYNDYYLDGRPSSTHTYYALNFIGSRNAVFKFGAGSLWGTGNEGNWKTDAFSLDSDDWQPAGTWPDVLPGSRTSVIAASTCMNPQTEDVYVGAPRLQRFDPRTGRFTSLASWPDNSTGVQASACAVDPVRNRVVYFRDRYRPPIGGLVYDATSNSFSRIQFSGPAVAEIMRGSYHFAWYEPKVGKFLLKTDLADAVYSIDPVSFEVNRVATIGGEGMMDAWAGVQSRWQRLPNLGGYAYYPRYGADVWFLAIE